MKIESEKVEIIKAFRDFSYVIPDYQREYIWKEKNVSQLLNDIHDEYLDDRDSEYFIGSIVVTKRDSGAFEVIDGQQRLTTLFISLCALKRLLKDSPQHLREVSSLLASQKSNERGEFSQSRHLDLQYEDRVKSI